MKRIVIPLAFAFMMIFGLIGMGLILAPVVAQNSVTSIDASQINPSSPRGKVPGEYVVTLKNETFAEINEQFPDKEQVTASNIPEENAQVNPAMKRQYDAQIAEIVSENVQAVNGTTPEEYPSSPLGEVGAKVESIFTFAIRGYSVTGLNNPSILIGNENISTVEQDDYKEPAAQYLPLAMNRQ